MAQQEFRNNAHRNLADVKAWNRKRVEPALDPALPIVDPHHHLWTGNERGSYLIPELTEDIADSGHNIVATVYIESAAIYRAEGPADMQAVGEVEFANGAAAISASGSYGRTRACAAIVGHADLVLGEHVQPVLEALIAAGNGRLCGIRDSVPWDSGDALSTYRRKIPRYRLLDPAFRAGYARLAPLGLSYDAWLFHPQMPELANLARAFPDTQIILDHAGGLLGIAPHDGNRDELYAVWRKLISELAQCPNVSVKIGGLGMLFCGWDFHMRDVPPSSEELAAAWRPYVETCIEAFGVERCMMESNFPVDKQTCSYGVLWNSMKRITQKYSASEKAALYRDTAARIYRLAV